MNPDFDDYDDVPGAQGDEPRTRALPRLVVVVAVLAFIALAWYAYRSGSDSVKPGDIEFVEAGSKGYKERPEEPGGEEFPHKDKTIYDAISPYAADDAPKVEKLLPEPEEPVKPKEVASGSAESWVNDGIRKQDEAQDAAAQPAKTVEEKAAELSKEVEASIAAPVAVKPVEVKPVATKPVEAAKPAPKPAPVVAEKPAAAASSGSYKVQLGAYKTEAEAKQTAARILGKNGDVLSGKPQSIVRADLPNGTFYRLRIGGFATPEAAKAACSKLSSRGQGCFYAGK